MHSIYFLPLVLLCLALTGFLLSLGLVHMETWRTADMPTFLVFVIHASVWLITCFLSVLLVLAFLCTIVILHHLIGGGINAL